jgi:uncharacterized protein
MKIIISNHIQHFLRFDKGEDVTASLAQYCKENNIIAAHFTTIGSAGEVVLSYYNLQTKQFEDHTIQEEIEIVSVIGNVSTMDANHIIHTHGVFSKKDLSTVGGHIKKLIVSATAEVFLTKLEGSLTRQHDPETGLNLFT